MNKSTVEIMIIAGGSWDAIYHYIYMCLSPARENMAGLLPKSHRLVGEIDVARIASVRIEALWKTFHWLNFSTNKNERFGHFETIKLKSCWYNNRLDISD